MNSNYFYALSETRPKYLIGLMLGLLVLIISSLALLLLSAYTYQFPSIPLGISFVASMLAFVRLIFLAGQAHDHAMAERE